MENNEKVYYDYRTYAAFRDNRNLKDADVAHAAGIDAGILSKWKTGRTTPRLTNMEKIAHAVGATPGRFRTNNPNVVKTYPSTRTKILVHTPTSVKDINSLPVIPAISTTPSIPIKNKYSLNTLQKIKILAIVNEVTMSEVAEMVDVPLDEILTWDKEDPRVGSLKKVANTFSCTLDELVNDKYNH